MKAYSFSMSKEHSFAKAINGFSTILVLLCTFLLLSHSLSAQSVQVKTSSKNGLSVVEAYTKSGKIKINLPDNIHARDRISGTVEAEPEGKNSRQLEKNASYLQGCVVEIEEQSPTRKGGSILDFVAPVAATAAMAVIKDSQGNTIGRFSIPVDPEPRPNLPDPGSQPSFDIPAVAQLGEPLSIPGTADGDLTNSVVKIGDTYYQPVAESPDGIIIIPETDIVPGSTPIQVMDGGPWVYGDINLIDLQLSASKLNLMRGERTQLTVVVFGLSGLDEPVYLHLTNNSPGFVRLGQGNVQQIEILPDMVGPDGTFQYIDILTGIMPGSFSISANIQAGQQDGEAPKDNAGEDDPTILREEANQLDQQADRLEESGRLAEAEALREQARRLRQQASALDWDWGGTTEDGNTPTSNGQNTTAPTQPRKPGKSYPVPVPVPLQDNSKPEPVGEAKKECDCNEVSKKQAYSRGNNNRAQLEKQFKNSGKKGYQYQTARIELDLSGKPGESCACENNKCKGNWVLKLGMKILNLLDPKDQGRIPDPTDFALLDGVEVKKGTTRCDNKVPAPNVRTTSERSNFPAPRAENKFTQPNARKRDYTSTAKVKVPCKPGTYHYRFLIVSKTFGGGNKTPGTSFGLPDLNAYVDVTVTITEEAVCQQKVKIEAHYLEFIAQYPWHPKGGAELPEVDYDIPGLEDRTGNAAPKGKTKNIAKLVEEDGNKVDDPFPARK